MINQDYTVNQYYTLLVNHDWLQSCSTDVNECALRTISRRYSLATFMFNHFEMVRFYALMNVTITQLSAVELREKWSNRTAAYTLANTAPRSAL